MHSGSFVRSVATIAFFVLSGCSSSSGSRTIGAHGGGSSLPQLVYQGGPLLTAATIVTVTFPGDPLVTQLQAFGQTLASSQWWGTVGAGYCGGGDSCVGDGPPGASVALTTAAAPSYSDSTMGGPSSLQQWLASAIASAALPGPDANQASNAIYVLYFPETTTIDLDGMKSCVENGFNGYHNSMKIGATQVAYAVVVECQPTPPPLRSIPQVTSLQSATIAASHEIIEAATDPSVTNIGFYLDVTDTNNWGWLDTAGGGEAADLCVDPFGLGQDETDEGAFTVQRVWSNSQARARLDPCNPRPANDVYFNAAPRQSLFVLDVGASVTFEVDAFSTGAMSDWTVSIEDWSDSLTTTYLAFSIDGGTQADAGPEVRVNNGSTITVTATLLADPGSLDPGEADGAIVSVSRGSSRIPVAHWWPFVVMSHADAADAGVASMDQAQSSRHSMVAAQERTSLANKRLKSSARRSMSTGLTR